jgi:hypothetical protein
VPTSAAMPESHVADEAQSISDLLRFSRVTVLLAEQGQDSSTFLKTRLMPLVETEHANEPSAIAIFFDTWDGSPLPDLLTSIRGAITGVTGSPTKPFDSAPLSLADALMSWQQTFDLDFILVLGRFEQYLGRLSDPSVRDFHEQFVIALNTSSLRINVVISIDERADSMLAPMRAAVPGFGDASLRIEARMKPTSTDASRLSSGSATHGLLGSKRLEIAASAAHHLASLDSPASASAVTGGAAPPDSVVRTAAESSERQAAETNFELAAPSAAAPGVPPGRLPKRGARLSRRRWLALGVLLLTLVLFWALMPRERASTVRHVPRAAPVLPSAPISNQAVPAPAADVAAPPAADRSEPVVAGPTANPPAPSSPSDSQPQRSSARASATHGGENAIAEGTPLVYIHVRTQAQRARAERFVDILAQRGIRVSGIKLVAAGPWAADLRYFRDHEAQEAAQVAKTLRDAGIATPRLKRIGGYEDAAKPHQYELWFAPEDGEAAH